MPKVRVMDLQVSIGVHIPLRGLTILVSILLFNDNIMKNITKISLTLFGFLSGACSDFLQEDLQGTYSNATFYKTEAHALLALTAVYNSASFVSTNNDLWVFGDVASDDATKGGLAGDQD